MTNSFNNKILSERDEHLASGRTIALETKHYRAYIDRRGAALQVLQWTLDDNTDVPLTESYGKESPFTCGQTLIPWPNRIADGQFLFENTSVAIKKNEPALRNAIHGLATDELWNVVEKAHDGSSVTLGFHYDPSMQKSSQGWPWEFSAHVRYTLSADGLTVTTSVKNNSGSTMPWGYGAHPYITAGHAALNQCVFHANVDDWWVTDDRLLPTGQHFPVGKGVPAINETTSMKDVWFDTPFTVSKETPVVDGWRELARLTGQVEDGRCISVVMDADTKFTWLQIFTTGEKTVMFPGKETGEGRALAVEPMTCPPNAMVTGQDLIVLAPSAEWSAQWRLHGELSSRS